MYAVSLNLRKNTKRKRKVWVKEIFQQQQMQGTFHTLLQEMQLQDRESHFR